MDKLAIILVYYIATGLTPVLMEQPVILCYRQTSSEALEICESKALHCGIGVTINVTSVTSSYNACGSGYRCDRCCSNDLADDHDLTTLTQQQCNDKHNCSPNILKQVLVAKIRFDCINISQPSLTTQVTEKTTALTNPNIAVVVTSSTSLDTLSSNIATNPIVTTQTEVPLIKSVKPTPTPDVTESTETKERKNTFPVVVVAVSLVVVSLAVAATAMFVVIRRHKRLQFENRMHNTINMSNIQTGNNITVVNNIYSEGAPNSADTSSSPGIGGRNVSPTGLWQNNEPTGEYSYVTRGPVLQSSRLYDHVTHHNNRQPDDMYSHVSHDVRRNELGSAAAVNRPHDANVSVYDNANVRRIADAGEEEDANGLASEPVSVEYAGVIR